MKMPLFSVCILNLLLAVSSCAKLRNYHETVNNTCISNIDIGSIPDGVYFGTADFTMVAADVNVTVSNGKIVAVELLRHVHGPNRGVIAEVLTNRIVENQSLELDSVSGATGSSKAILKAVENALSNASL